MNNIQNYGSFNVNSNYGKVRKSPNFKAYNVNEIREALKHGVTPSKNVIKEMQADVKKIFESNNIGEKLKGYKLSTLIEEIDKINLQMHKKQLELAISIKEGLLLTANPEKKMEIKKAIEECKDEIKKIDEIIGN